MKVPFDSAMLDAEMETAGIDVLLATSPHNVRYMLGGYRFRFFMHHDAISSSRYLPVVGYPRSRLDHTFYVGTPNEKREQEMMPPLWVGDVKNSAWSTVDAAREVASLLVARGLNASTIGIERAWISEDAATTLASELPQAKFVDGAQLFESLRAVKRPEELTALRQASEAIVDSMLQVIKGASRGITTAELEHRLWVAETERGLTFQYGLIAAGRNLNRTPSMAQWEEGMTLSLDSGGNKNSYVGDVARMAVFGQPSTEMREQLDEVLAIQQAARKVIRAGTRGREIFESAASEQRLCPHRTHITFLAHGMGLVSHEEPRLTSSGAVPYAATYQDRPIAAGMVLSIETELADPSIGFIKIEDTVAVTETGCVGYGDTARGWNSPLAASA